MPENTVYVGRPTKWGNPFAFSREMTLYKSLEKYQEWLSEKLANDPHFLDPLQGKNLACWCPEGRTCHADILLALVDKGRRRRQVFETVRQSIDFK